MTLLDLKSILDGQRVEINPLSDLNTDLEILTNLRKTDESFFERIDVRDAIVNYIEQTIEHFSKEAQK